MSEKVNLHTMQISLIPNSTKGVMQSFTGPYQGPLTAYFFLLAFGGRTVRFVVYGEINMPLSRNFDEMRS